MSGVELEGRSIRKGAADAIRRWVAEAGGAIPAELETTVDADRRPQAAPRSSSPRTAGPSASSI